MKLSMKVAGAVLASAVFIAVIGLVMFFRIDGQLVEKQEQIQQAISVSNGLSEAVLDFNAENYQTQLQVWEYAFRPTEARLNGFYVHEAAFTERFNAMIATASIAESDVANDAVVAALTARFDALRTSWLHITAPS